jgi:hypothetical protein
MTIYLNTKLFDVDGKEIIPSGGKPMTLRDVIFNSILVPLSDKEEEKKKFEKYEIYKKIKDAKGGEVDLESQEIATIKTCIGQLQPPLVMGQAWEMLEGKFERQVEANNEKK